MSRRLATVVRVAGLQEAVARGHAGAALAALRAADDRYADAARVLSDTGLAGGSVGALRRSAAERDLRAQAVAEAESGARAAAAARDEALARWGAAQRRLRLLEELHARQRAEAAAARERSAQRLADDLSAARLRTGER